MGDDFVSQIGRFYFSGGDFTSKQSLGYIISVWERLGSWRLLVTPTYASCNLFIQVTESKPNELQRILNSLDRVLLQRAPSRTKFLALLGPEHWFPVEFWISFKLTCLTYKILIKSRSDLLSTTNLCLHLSLQLVIFSYRSLGWAKMQHCYGRALLHSM